MQPTFSDALTNNTPYWGAQAIRAARDSEGFFISVTDKEVAGMLQELGKKEGLYLEPAGAVSVTGLRKAILEKPRVKLCKQKRHYNYLFKRFTL